MNGIVKLLILLGSMVFSALLLTPPLLLGMIIHNPLSWSINVKVTIVLFAAIEFVILTFIIGYSAVISVIDIKDEEDAEAK